MGGWVRQMGGWGRGWVCTPAGGAASERAQWSKQGRRSRQHHAAHVQKAPSTALLPLRSTFTWHGHFGDVDKRQAVPRREPLALHGDTSVRQHEADAGAVLGSACCMVDRQGCSRKVQTTREGSVKPQGRSCRVPAGCAALYPPPGPPRPSTRARAPWPGPPAPR